MVTLCFAVGHDHATDDRCKFSLNAEETFEESCCSFYASSFIGCVGLDVVAVGGIETEAVMVVVALFPHFFTKADGVEIACVGELASPF